MPAIAKPSLVFGLLMASCAIASAQWVVETNSFRIREPANVEGEYDSAIGDVSPDAPQQQRRSCVLKGDILVLHLCSGSAPLDICLLILSHISSQSMIGLCAAAVHVGHLNFQLWSEHMLHHPEHSPHYMDSK